MKLSDLSPYIGWGGAELDRVLASVLTGLAQDGKLGHLKVSLVDGATAGTAITLTGASADDVFLGAVVFVGAGTDVTDVVLITEATFGTDSITFPADTSGSKVLVLWVDVDARNVQE